MAAGLRGALDRRAALPAVLRVHVDDVAGRPDDRRTAVPTWRVAAVDVHTRGERGRAVLADGTRRDLHNVQARRRLLPEVLRARRSALQLRRPAQPGWPAAAEQPCELRAASREQHRDQRGASAGRR